MRMVLQATGRHVLIDGHVVLTVQGDEPCRLKYILWTMSTVAYKDVFLCASNPLSV